MTLVHIYTPEQIEGPLIFSHQVLYWLSSPSFDSNFCGPYNSLDKSMLQEETSLWLEQPAYLYCAPANIADF